LFYLCKLHRYRLHDMMCAITYASGAIDGAHIQRNVTDWQS